MPRYMIEFTHPSEYEGCLRSLDAIRRHGSHLITNSDWGCEDDVHTGWLIADVDTREEALQLVPPQYRTDTRVIKLRRWSTEEIEAMMRELEARSESS